ncbi:hypothetical protein [Siccirubricoccus sp. G192]|uniref:hypothetical protein n=1 Tax=Siccirubricoccus sp. G192 TaxID=2849651 RepID=UPI001C2BCB21|nr:hypothetical protein [Siccirubricoccus sp. G192]MBV1795601.1 hypothetical protein [Siccirubricoccus sp. G192]MBV1800275.1 hypothetical protein [Siccirubricoccus sp. G192]
MLYLLAFLAPPVAILLAGRPFQALFNALLWALGLVLLILPFVPGLLTWGLAVLWAVVVVRNRQAAARDRRLVEDAIERDRARRSG